MRRKFVKHKSKVRRTNFPLRALPGGDRVAISEVFNSAAEEQFNWHCKKSIEDYFDFTPKRFDKTKPKTDLGGFKLVNNRGLFRNLILDYDFSKLQTFASNDESDSEDDRRIREAVIDGDRVLEQAKWWPNQSENPKWDKRVITASNPLICRKRKPRKSIVVNNTEIPVYRKSMSRSFRKARSLAAKKKIPIRRGRYLSWVIMQRLSRSKFRILGPLESIPAKQKLPGNLVALPPLCLRPVKSRFRYVYPLEVEARLERRKRKALFKRRNNMNRKATRWEKTDFQRGNSYRFKPHQKSTDRPFNRRNIESSKLKQAVSSKSSKQRSGMLLLP